MHKWRRSDIGTSNPLKTGSDAIRIVHQTAATLGPQGVQTSSARIAVTCNTIDHQHSDRVAHHMSLIRTAAASTSAICLFGRAADCIEKVQRAAPPQRGRKTTCNSPCRPRMERLRFASSHGAPPARRLAREGDFAVLHCRCLKSTRAWGRSEVKDLDDLSCQAVPSHAMRASQTQGTSGRFALGKTTIFAKRSAALTALFAR